MNTEAFLAWRFIRGDQNRAEKGSSTRPVIRIAVGGIVVGMAVMLLSVAVLTGFQQEIRQKVIGFGGHIQVTHFDSEEGFEQRPVSIHQAFYPNMDTLPQIRNIQVYANKAGILKTEEEILGVVLKGVGSDFNGDFFQRNLVSGTLPSYANSKRNDSVLVSQEIASRMKLGIGDRFVVYFIQNNKPRPRKFTVGGIYTTGLEGFDDLFLLGDLRHIQRINGWKEDEVGGFEINLMAYEDLGSIDELIYRTVPYDLKSSTIVSRHSDIFGWLELQDINVIIILLLIILVSGINMTSALLILILERTREIGILKAMGARNWLIRKLFLIHAAYLIGIGLFWGNLLGIGIGFLQQQFGFITLPQGSYYLTHVPVNLEISHILLLNAGTLILCTAMMVIPSYIVTKISPVRAIRFD